MGAFDINWFALIVAAFIPLAVGAIWYGPLFGKLWQKEVGITEETLKNGNYMLIFGLSLVFAFMLAFSLWAQVMIGGGPGEAHGAAPYLSFKHGAFHGVLLSLFILLPVLGTIALYERKSLRYIAITIGYWMLSFALMGGLINGWP